MQESPGDPTANVIIALALGGNMVNLTIHVSYSRFCCINQL